MARTTVTLRRKKKRQEQESARKAETQSRWPHDGSTDALDAKAYKFLQMSMLHITARDTFAISSHLDLIVDGANAVDSLVVRSKIR